MNKKNILFLLSLIILSLFTYFKQNELEKSKEYTNLLISNLENTENDLINIKLELNEKNEELEIFKLHYKMEYEARNLIDIKVRKIFDALMNQDIDILKSEVSSKVIVENEKIVFENGYNYNLLKDDYIYVLRQRHYSLNENNLNFFTGYEIINENWEFLPVYNFDFVNENGEWKLNNIYEE